MTTLEPAMPKVAVVEFAAADEALESALDAFQGSYNSVLLVDGISSSKETSSKHSPRSPPKASTSSSP